MERGDDSTARDLLERALAADPRSAEAHTYLGALADRAGDLAAAERHFAAAARLAPRSARARNNHGAILLRLGRIPEATAEFEASLRLDPNQSKALVNLAQIRFDSGSPEGLRVADALFRRADALAPDVEIARALTIIALRRGDRTRAADRYRVYAMRLANATGDLLPAAGARSDLGGALFEAGLLAEAEAELNAALMLDPANAETVLRLARVHLARKDLPAAGRALEGALARKVESPAIYALLAVVYEKSGRLENAIPAMRMAIQLDPQSEKYRFQYGVLLTENDAPAAALIRLNEALQSFPKSSRLHLAIGLANLKMSRNDEAVRAFKRAIELDPELAQAYACLGMASALAGRYEESAGFYEQALRKAPNIAIFHYLLADALLKQAAGALRIKKSLRRAISLDANYAPARLALGKLRARAGRLPEAVAEFEQAVRLDPNLAEAYYQLGRALSRLKRAAEAQTALDAFKRLSDSQKRQEQDSRRDIMRRLADVVF